MIKIKKEDEYLIGYNENNVACCYYPLTKEAKELDLPELPNPFEEKINISENLLEHWQYKIGLKELKEDSDKAFKERKNAKDEISHRLGYVFGVKSAEDRLIPILQELKKQSKQYSLEDMKKAFEEGSKHKYVCEANGKDKKCYCRNDNECNLRHYMTAEEFIQSLSTQQLPKEFVLGEGGTIEEQIKNGYYIW